MRIYKGVGPLPGEHGAVCHNAGLMTLLTAIAYLIAGALCMQRPERIAGWLGRSLGAVAGPGAAEAEWLRGRGMRIAIRLVGVLALLNAVMLFATMGHV